MPQRPPLLAKVIDRIRKLVALAQGGASESEAEQAMARVHGLLAEHNLRLPDVLAGAPPGAPPEAPADRVLETVEAADHPWERPIWSATAALYFCAYFYEGRPGRTATGAAPRAARVRHNLVGKPHNILVARLMTDYFLKTIRRLARQEACHLPPSARRSFAHSFQVACARRLAHRIWLRKCASEIDSISLDPRDGASRLPALRPLYNLEDEANRALLAALGIRLVPGSGPGTRITDILGEVAGKAAADGIGLDPQLPDGRPSPTPGPQPPADGQMDLPLG